MAFERTFHSQIFGEVSSYSDTVASTEGILKLYVYHKIDSIDTKSRTIMIVPKLNGNVLTWYVNNFFDSIDKSRTKISLMMAQSVHACLNVV